MKTIWAFILAAMLGLAAPMVATPAFAQDNLADAKTQGLIGEMPNGLIGAVAAKPTAAVSALVADINAKRMQKYKEIAQKNGTSVDAVQALAGKQLIERAAAGEYVMVAGQGWVRK